MKLSYPIILIILSCILYSCNKESKIQPNIIMILADDLGWMDSGVYGSEYYDTPNIDRLATQGVRFTRAYAANPQCSPTRASIMTGKFPERLKFTYARGHNVPYIPNPKVHSSSHPHNPATEVESANALDTAEVTIAEMLKKAGYQTLFLGKWHLGGHSMFNADQQGFDKMVGGTGIAAPYTYFSPFKIRTVTNGKIGTYLTDQLAIVANRFMEKLSTEEKPFFLCMWNYAVHTPLQAPKELVKEYAAKKDPRQKQLSPTMAAMIKKLDDCVGSIIDKTEELNIDQNTIIIFLSDNGGNMYNLIDGVPPTNNAPLRGGKATVYEGGIRVPQIIKWPGVVDSNTVTSVLTSTIDLFPTIMDMAHQNYEADSVDGQSIVPILKRKAKQHERHLFCHFPHYPLIQESFGPATTVFNDQYKLIKYYHQGKDTPHKYELYDLENDIEESNNLAEKERDMVHEMDKLIVSHIKESGALVPNKNPKYDPNVVPKRKGIHPVLLRYFN